VGEEPYKFIIQDRDSIYSGELESSIRQTLKTWTGHYNRGPHSSLGPGIPDSSVAKVELQNKRHCIPKDCHIASTSVLAVSITNIGWKEWLHEAVAFRQPDRLFAENSGMTTYLLLDCNFGFRGPFCHFRRRRKF
jgi:hypothetical protein